MTADFNKEWIFYKKGEEASKKTVNLPHDAMIHETRVRCVNGSNSGYFPGGYYIYEKDFEITREQIGKYIAVCFEGVYRNATVYLNNQKVFFHAYGYTFFTVDISSSVKEGTNSIRVEVDNLLEPNSRWYSGSGIYRKVSFIVKEKDYLRDVKIQTVSINPPTIQVSASSDATVEIYDQEKLIATSSLGTIVLKDAKLWDDVNPYLYRIVVRSSTDEVSCFYGIRELKWSSRNGVTVNGREVKLRGSCIHHDNGILGAVELKDASERRIRILKEQGYNAIRSSHHPCSNEILDACDKYGMYVMDESFDVWYIPKTYHDYSRDFFDNYKEDLQSMVAKDYNHPSVIMYSLGNENSELSEEKGLTLLQEQAALVKALDPTRIVTLGANLMIIGGMKVYKEDKEYKKEPISLENNKDLMAKLDKAGSSGFNMIMGVLPSVMTSLVKGKKYGVITDKLEKPLDVLGLNYAYTRYEIDFRRNPEKIYVGSETYNQHIVKNWELVKKYHQLIGDFCWTGWDYLGEAGTCGAFDYRKWEGRPIADGAGAIDLIGNPTAVNYYMQIEYGTYEKPFIAVAPVNYYKEKYLKGGWRMNNYLHSWSYRGLDGIPTTVEVYAKAYQVALFLNGKQIGTKRTKENIAKFKTKYYSGTLRAVAMDVNKNVLGEDILTTAAEETIIRLATSKTNLQANGMDLCYLNIDLTDLSGEIKPDREDEIEISLNGKSVALAGFGTARTKIAGNYDQTRTNAHFGRALAILRAAYLPGQTEVTVKVKGLEDQKIVICVD